MLKIIGMTQSSLLKITLAFLDSMAVETMAYSKFVKLCVI